MVYFELRSEVLFVPGWYLKRRWTMDLHGMKDNQRGFYKTLTMVSGEVVMQEEEYYYLWYYQGAYYYY